MKDLYKRLTIEVEASEQQIRDALASPAIALDPATHDAAEFVLLDPGRRSVYDHSHRVLTTIGHLRSHLGLNLKPFWSRGKFKDYTTDLTPPAAGRPRRILRSLRPADITRAFGLTARADRMSAADDGRRRLLKVAILLLAGGFLVAAYIAYTLFAGR